MLLADHCNSASARALFGVFVNDTDSLRRWWDVATSASVSFKILLLSTQWAVCIITSSAQSFLVVVVKFAPNNDEQITPIVCYFVQGSPNWFKKVLKMQINIVFH